MKNKNRCIALVMATALLVTSVVIPGNSVYAAENINKEEVVYIMTDANGNVCQVPIFLHLRDFRYS